jgi:hypothetical protein
MPKTCSGFSLKPHKLLKLHMFRILDLIRIWIQTNPGQPVFHNLIHGRTLTWVISNCFGNRRAPTGSNWLRPASVQWDTAIDLYMCIAAAKKPTLAWVHHFHGNKGWQDKRIENGCLIIEHWGIYAIKTAQIPLSMCLNDFFVMHNYKNTRDTLAVLHWLSNIRK